MKALRILLTVIFMPFCFFYGVIAGLFMAVSLLANDTYKFVKDII